MNVDANRLILAVKNRPAIWDVRTTEYGNRIHKMKQWDEIMNMFSDEDESSEVKFQIAKSLQQKWRTLRDAFVKSYRAQAKSDLYDPQAKNRRPYKYYKQLLFLIPVVGNSRDPHHIVITRASDEHLSDNDANSNASEEWLDDGEVPPEPKRTKKAEPTENNDSELLSAIRKSMLQQNVDEEADCDRQFMLSLVSDFKRVPSKLKPMVKINILKCIVDAQNEENDQQEVRLIKHETDEY